MGFESEYVNYYTFTVVEPNKCLTPNWTPLVIALVVDGQSGHLALRLSFKYHQLIVSGTMYLLF